MRNWLGKLIKPLKGIAAHTNTADDQAAYANAYRLESLEPRLLLSGDPISAELARVAQDDSYDNSDDVAAIIHEIDNLDENLGADQSSHNGNNKMQVVWPQEWRQTDAEVEQEHEKINLRSVIAELVHEMIELRKALQSTSNPSDLVISIQASSDTVQTNYFTGSESSGSDSSSSDSDSDSESSRDDSSSQPNTTTDAITHDILKTVLQDVLQSHSESDADSLLDLQIQVADLEGEVVAELRDDILFIDIDAAGNGWFVDPALLAQQAQTTTADAAADTAMVAMPVLPMDDSRQGASVSHDSVLDGTTSTQITVDIEDVYTSSNNRQSTSSTGDGATQDNELPPTSFDIMDAFAGTTGHGDSVGGQTGGVLLDAHQEVDDALGAADNEDKDSDNAELIIGMVAAAHRLQENNRANRNESNRDNTNKSAKNAGSDAAQVLPDTSKLITPTILLGDDADARAPPIEQDATTNNDDQDTDTVALDAAVYASFDNENTVSGSSPTSALSSADDDNDDSSVLAEADMPRAPPAEDAMPRAPPADNTHNLLVAGPVKTSGTSTPLSQSDLNAAVTRALQLWTAYATAIGDAQLALDIAALNVTTNISDLPARLLGQSDSSTDTITIDTTAAGYGWFIDSSLTDNAEFSLIVNSLRLEAASSTSAADGLVDLLTVVIHEVGHLLNFDHDSNLEVMADELAISQRVLLGDTLDLSSETGTFVIQININGTLDITGTSASDVIGGAGVVNIVLAPTANITLRGANTNTYWLLDNNGQGSLDGEDNPSFITFSGLSGSDTIIGGDADDDFRLDASFGSVNLQGGAGEDSVIVEQGVNQLTFDGGTGTDAVVNLLGAAASTLVSVETEIDRPVLFIHGFAGSLARDTSEAGIDAWLRQRGMHPDDLALEPLGESYTDFMQSLENVGYEDGTHSNRAGTLYAALWDWRVPVAESDTNHNGELENVTYASLTDASFDTALDYLVYWINKVKADWLALTGNTVSLVDIITHSTGGLVARSYIQSQAYRDSGSSLPRVNTLLQVGVPNQGTGATFNFLNNDFSQKSASRVLGLVAGAAYEVYLAENTGGILAAGVGIRAPDGTPFDSGMSETQFIEAYVSTLTDLLSINPFIDDDGDSSSLDSTLLSDTRNDLLLDLNSDSSGAFSADEFVSGTVKTRIVYGSGVDTDDIAERYTGPQLQLLVDNEILPMGELFGHLPGNSEVWHNLVGLDTNKGDGTVPSLSAIDGFDSGLLIERANIGHTELVHDVDSQRSIIAELGIFTGTPAAAAANLAAATMSTSNALSLVGSLSNLVRFGIIADGPISLGPIDIHMSRDSKADLIALLDGDNTISTFSAPVLMQIEDFVIVSGVFTFELERDLVIDISTGLPANLVDFLTPITELANFNLGTLENIPVTALKISAADAHAFVGLNGFADLDGSDSLSFTDRAGNTLIADLDEDGYIDVVTIGDDVFGDINMNGLADPGETAELDSDRVGIEMNGLNMAFARFFVPLSERLSAPYLQYIPSLYSLKGTAASAALVGIEGVVDASAKDITIEINSGGKWKGDIFGPAVTNFQASFPNELLYYDVNGIGASANDGVLQLSDIDQINNASVYTTLFNADQASANPDGVITYEELLSLYDGITALDADGLLQITEVAALSDADINSQNDNGANNGLIENLGLRVPFGSANDAHYLDFDGNYRIGAAADTVELTLANFVHIIGGFSFEKGPTHKVDVATGLPANLVDLIPSLVNSIQGLAQFANDYLTSVSQLADLNPVTRALLQTYAAAQGLALSTATDIHTAITSYSATELWIEPDLSAIHNLEVDSLQIGANNVHAFVGLNGPYRSDTNGDGIVDSNDGIPNADAVGLAIDNVDFGYVTMAPTLSVLPGLSGILPKFTAIKATADFAGLVGMADVLEASVKNIVIEVNNGTSWPGDLGPPVVDFSSSFANDEILNFFDNNNSGAITVADLRALGVNEVVGLYDSLTDGALVISSQEMIVALGGTDGILDLIDVIAFGDASGDDLDGDLKLDLPGYEVRTGSSTAPIYIDYDGNQRIGASADTVELSLANFVYVIGSFSFQKGPTHKVDVATGLPANLGDLIVSLSNAVDDLAEFAEDYLTTVNQLSDLNPVTQSLLQAYATGLSLSLNTTQEIRDAITSYRANELWIEPDLSAIHNLEVDSLQIGSSNAHAFVGINGPYRSDVNGDGVVDVNDGLPDTDAVGLAIDNVDFGYVAMAPTLAGLPGFDQILPKFTALRATADSAALVGMETVLQASLKDIVIEVNNGTAWPGGIGPPVVNFSTSFATDEVLNFFDYDGVGGITVADLRNLGVTSVANLYDSNSDGAQSISSQELIDALDDNLGQYANDGQLQLSEVSAFGDGAGSITASVADADGDGKLDIPGYEVRTGTTTAPVYINYDGNQRIGASADEVLLQLANFVHIMGSFSFEKGPTHRVDVATGLPSVFTAGLEAIFNELGGLPTADPGSDRLWVESNFSVIHNVEVDSMQIGASNVHTFVGINGPYWTDLDHDGVIDPPPANPADPSEINEDAIGVVAEGIDFGFVTMSPTLGGLPGLDGLLPKFTAIKAVSDLVSFVGIDDIEMILEGIEINVNDGTAWPLGLGPPVIDFSTSFDNDEVETFFDVDGVGGITVADLKALNGNLTSVSGLYDATTENTLAISSTDIIAALGGTDGQLQLAEVSQFGMGANGITAVGADDDGDGKLDPIGYEIRTGTTTAPVYIDYDGNQRIGASSERATVQLSEFVHIVGSIAFEMGPVQTVDVTGGLLSSLGADAGAYLTEQGLPPEFVNSSTVLGAPDTELSFMTIGASDVNAFIGMDGPYWIDDLDGDRDISWALPDGETFDSAMTINGVNYSIGQATDGITLTNIDGTAMPTVTVNGVKYGDLDTDGEVDANETAELDVDAIGLAVKDFDFGMAIMTPVNPVDFAKYYALKATADQITMVGIEGATVEADQLLVEVNLSSPSVYGISLFPVVDFAGTSQFASEQLALFDENNNGTLSLGDLRTLYEALTPTQQANFAGLSAVANNDSTIVTHEMLLGILNTNDTGDSRGIIDITEAAALLGGDNQAVTDAQNADLDGDGKIDPLGYEVKTGGDPVYLAMDESIIRAQGFLELNLFDTLIITGSVAFELGGSETVTLSNGDTQDVTTMTIGAANVSAFIGVDGPYWDDLDGDFTVIGDELVELNPDAIGFAITELDIGVSVMAAIGLDAQGLYLATKASVNSFDLVGIDGLTATGTFDVALNLGIGLSGFEPNLAVVDFDASFNEFNTLFDVIDVSGNGTIETSELNTALAAVYVGEDVSTVERLVSALNIGGAPQTSGITLTDLLNTLSTSFKNTHLDAINDADADRDGKLDFGFEVNTGNPASPVLLDFDQFLINIQLGGELELTDVFRMYGVFLFEIDSLGLKAFVAAGIEIGPDIGSTNQLFSMNALGALVINGAGVAADINISISIGGALSDVLKLDATARLVFNTTSQNQQITIPAKYVNLLLIGGDTIAASDNFEPSQVDGLQLSQQELENRFTFNANDGTATYTIADRAPGTTQPGSYLYAAFDGKLTVLNMFEISAAFELLLSDQAFKIGFTGNLKLGGFGSFEVSGGVVIDGNGFAAFGSLFLDIDVGNLGLVTIKGGATLQINTGSDPSGVDVPTGVPGQSFNVAANTAKVALMADINLFGVVGATADIAIGVENGLFEIAINDLNIDLFILNLDVNGFIRGDGQFSLNGSVSLPDKLRNDTWGILGNLSVSISNSGFTGSGSIGIRVFGQDFNIAAAELSITSDPASVFIRAEGPLGVYITVLIDSNGIEFGGGLGFLDDVIGAIADVAEAVGDAVVVAAEAVADAFVALGDAILDFGADVVQFFDGLFTDIGDLFADVGAAIAQAFSSTRTIVVAPPNPVTGTVNSYSVASQGRVLSITNSSASQIAVAIVNGRLIVDAPDSTANVVVAQSKFQTRRFSTSGWPWEWGWTAWSTQSTTNIVRSVTFTNMSDFVATSFDKIIIHGTNNAETIILDKDSIININAEVYGNGGHDTIVTGGGNDYVEGGRGNDTIFTYGGNDTVYGDVRGNNQIAGNDKLIGGAGNDTLIGGPGDDLLDESFDRGDNPDLLLTERNTLIGGSGVDKILGSPGIDTIEGGEGNDVITGLNNDDIYVFRDNYGTDLFADYYGKTLLDFSQVTSHLDILISEAGFTATDRANAANSFSIDDFIQIGQNVDFADFEIVELKTGAGNDVVAVTALPLYQIDIIDSGGSDTYDFDFDQVDTDQAVARVDIVDNSGNNDRIELDLDSTGYEVYLHPLAVLMNKLNLTFNSGVEYLDLTDQALQTTITTSPTSGLTELLVKSGVTIRSATGGPIEFLARDDFDFQAGAFIETTGDVSIRGDIDNVDATGATINLLGTINADTVAVYGGNDNDTVTVAKVTTGSATTISTFAGMDTVNIQTINAETTIHAGTENDTVNVGTSAPATGGNVNGIDAALIVNGEGGSDTLNVDDTGDTIANTGNLTSTGITGLGMAAGITYGTIEQLNIGLGTVDDVFTIQSTHNAATRLESNGGSDVINIQTIDGVTHVDSGNDGDTINVGSNANGTLADRQNNSNGNLDSIGALLTIDGNSPASGSDVLTIDDAGDMTPNTGVLTATTITGLGLSPAGINYTAIEHLIISLGNGGNTFTINGTHGAATSGFVEDTIINTGGGTDLIVINDVTDTLVVNGEAEADTMNVNATGLDSMTTLNGGGGDDIFNINNVSGTLVVNGEADADTMNLNHTSLNSLVTLNGGGGNDIFNIRAMEGRVNVNGGAGADTINVGSDTPTLPLAPTTQEGSIDNINGLLTVNGGTGTGDVLNLDDSNPLNDAKAATLTDATIRGLELEQGIDYLNLDELNIWLAIGNNVFTIDSSHDGETNVNTALGNDRVDINDASGELTINGEAGNDMVNVRGTSLASRVHINGQEGDDIVNLSDTSATLPAPYPTTLPPPAADTIGSVDNINGLIVINGGLANDTINIDDSRNTTDLAGVLTATTLRGLELEAGVDYHEAEDLNIWLGTGSDTFYIDGTHAGTTQLYAGDGNNTTNQRDDTVAIRSISGETTIHGQAGNDGLLANVKYDGGVPPLVGSDAVNDVLFSRTHLNGLDAVLNLHGEGDTDDVTLNLAGEGTALINVYDNGAENNGADTLTINGADTVAGIVNQPDDTFLLRRDLVVLLNESVAGSGFDQAERVNYDENINAGLTVNGLGGNDKIVADDNSSITTLDGGDGNDTFQIGQVFGTPRDANAGLDTGDTFDTTPIIIGLISNPDPLTWVGGVAPVIFDPNNFDPVTDVLPQATLDAINTAIAYQANLGLALDGVAYVSDGVTHAATVLGGNGEDVFNVYHNKGDLRLEGEAGNDEFIVRGFVTLDLSAQGASVVSGGSGADTINYAINAPVSIDGGSGFDKVVVLGTPFNDSFVVTADGFFGAGLNVTFANVENTELDTLEGDDTIYILGTGSDVVTRVIGGLGNDTIEVMGDVLATIISDQGNAFAPQDQNLDQIKGPLIIEGGAGPGVTRALNAPVLLPGEIDDASEQISADINEADDFDTLNVFHTDNNDADSGAMIYRIDDGNGNPIANPGLALTGFEMGANLSVAEASGTAVYGGGITFNGLEIVELLLGKGDETLNIADTGDRDEKDTSITKDPRSITVAHGGGGNDTIVITGRGEGALVVFGDTSQDGVRYSNDQALGSIHGTAFNAPGDDVIDATLANNWVVAYGGAGNDSIFGSAQADHLAGGSGNDIIWGRDGNDHIYGDDGFNIDLSTSLDLSVQPLTVVTAPSTGDFPTGDLLNAGSDEIHGEGGNDYILGDHGVIDQAAGINRLTSTMDVVEVRTVRADDGDVDVITGDDGNDVIFAGSAGDFINFLDPLTQGSGESGNDLMVADNGRAEFVVLLADRTSRVIFIETYAPKFGGNDFVFTGEGRKILFGGTGTDVLLAGGDAEQDFVIGDEGQATFSATSGNVLNVSTQTPDAGDADIITAGDGPNVLVGGSGGDTITAGDAASLDIIIGDNGFALFDDSITGLSILREIHTSDPDIGVRDIISSGQGPDVVLGGSGGDDIKAGTDGSRDVVVGDNGFAIFDPSGVLTEIRTTVPATGGNDDIIVGDGDDFVLGGVGSDYINVDRVTGLPIADDTGKDVIIGDNGFALFDSVAGSSLLREIRTTDPENGDRDLIFAADGFDVVLGGSGSDDIDAGTDGSRDVVVGDNGFALFDADEVLIKIQTTNPAIGGDDDIVVGEGDDFVLGGVGSDYINVDRATGLPIADDTGKDVIIGDNGFALFDSVAGSSLLREIRTSDAQHGDRDVIFAADGFDVVLGGSGSDDIDAGTDGSRDIVIGDNGEAFFNAQEVLLEIRTTAPSFGGNDEIRTGNGFDVVLGGDADDLILASGADSVADARDLIDTQQYHRLDPGDSETDIVLGDNGEAFFTDQAVLTEILSTDPEDGGNDVIVTGNGKDIVIAGVADDLVLAAGNDHVVDIVVGDNGRATFAGTETFNSPSASDLSGEEYAILSFNFNAYNTNTIVTGVAGTPDDVAGSDLPAPQAGNWNNLQGDGPTTYGDQGEELILFDNGDIAPGITIAWGEDLASDPDDLSTDTHSQISTPVNDDQRLFEGYLYTSTSHTLGVDIFGLSAHFETYDVYVYLDADKYKSHSQTSVRSIELGDTKYFLNDVDGNTFAGIYVQVDSTDPNVPGVGNYVVFTGLSSDVASIRIDDDKTLFSSSSNKPAISAIQVVGRSYPIDRVHTLDAGFGGNDTILTGGGADLIFGGSGADVINSAGDADLGELDADVVFGDNGIATFLVIDGQTELRDVISTDSNAIGIFDDEITTGNGEDTVVGGPGKDNIDTGDNGPHNAVDDGQSAGDVEVISINFNSGSSESEIDGNAGAVADADWNNFDNLGKGYDDDDDDHDHDHGHRPLQTFVTSEGIEVTVGQDLDGLYPRAVKTDNHSNLDPDTQNGFLYNGYIYANNSRTLGVDITGLDLLGPSYDVYVYLDADNGRSSNASSIRSISDGSTTFYLNDPDGNTFSGEFVQVGSTDAGSAATGNYVVFRNVSGDAFSLRIDGLGTGYGDDDDDDPRNYPSIAGLQIVGGTARGDVVVQGDFEKDVVVGDSGLVRFFQGVIYQIETTDLVSGNDFDADTITTGDGADIVLGGNGPDHIIAGSGDDIVLGDNARISLFQGSVIGLEHDDDGWQFSGHHHHDHDHGHNHDHDDSHQHGHNDYHHHGHAYKHDHYYNHDNYDHDDDDHDHHHHDFDAYHVTGIRLLGTSIGGDDIIEGGTDDDLMYGQFGNDTFVFSGGALGNDRVVEAGNDHHYRPNDLHDQLDFSGFNQAIDIDLGTTHTQVYAISYTDNSTLTLSSSTGLEVVVGSQFDDEIEGNSRDNFLFGLDGDDDIDGEYGDDMLDGGSDKDELEGGQGDDRLYGREGNDVLYGDDGNDRLYGGDGEDYMRGGDDHDILQGDAGNDRLYGDKGDDLLAGGTGNDRIEGGSGHDLLYFPGALTGVTVTLTKGGKGIATDGLGGNDELRSSIEGAIGTDFMDVLTGDDGRNEFRGMGGNDIIDGRRGDDLLLGGDGDDEIYGNRGDDTLIGEGGDDMLYGGDDDDILQGNAGNDVIDAGDDDDIVMWVEGDGNDTIEMGDGWDSLRVLMGDSDDQLSVTSSVNNKVSIAGTSPAAWILDIAQGDVIDIDTGAGDDVVAVGNLADTDVNKLIVSLGDGDDRLESEGATTPITAYGGAGDDWLHGGQADDQLYGGPGNDQLFGGPGNDKLYGGEGDDVLDGGPGKDKLDGGPGDDVIIDPDKRHRSWWWVW